MIIVHSKNNIPVRLTEERWNHIIRRHPEIENMREQFLETIVSPEIVLEGDYGELLAVKRFRKTPLTEKYLVVAYKEISTEDGFVLTGYLTNKPSERRKVIWKR